MANTRPDEKLKPWQDPQALPYVRIERVTKRFGDFVAVNHVSLDIYQGEAFCLLGASGCDQGQLTRTSRVPLVARVRRTGYARPCIIPDFTAVTTE